MGISFAPGAVASNLQDLAWRAQAGDKQAQLDLGIAYEEGFGVPVDLKRAEGLYRMASLDSGGTIYVYQPPVRKGGRSGMVPVDTGPIVKGLGAAKVRLIGTRVQASNEPSK
jgi:hypothetical protein